MTHLVAPCCVPSKHRAQILAISRTGSANRLRAETGSPEGMVALRGGSFRMGTDCVDGFPADGEGPVRDVMLDPFFLDAFPVTNAAFLAFVEAAQYKTEAERFGWSFVFAGDLPREMPEARARRPRTRSRLVAAHLWRRLAASGRPRDQSGGPAEFAGRACFVERRGRLCGLGRASGFPPRQSGSMPRAEAWSRRSIPGGMTLLRTACIAATSGRANSRPITPPRMVSRA